MGKESHIQWTDATWNIAVGCKKVDADCKFCYMYRDSLNGTRYDPKEIRKTKTVFDLPLKLKQPSRIFTSSLTDVFLPELDAIRPEMWEIIQKCPQHTFQILTKRPERISNISLHHESTGPGSGIIYRNMPNVWIGTSVGSPDGLQRIADLIQGMWRGIKFLSIEPYHQAIDLRPFLSADKVTGKSPIHWVIVGGESGNDNGKYRYRPCELEWIEDVINKCWEADVPVFVKQLGTHLAKKMGLKDRHGGDISEWPEHLRIRQFPKT